MIGHLIVFKCILVSSEGLDRSYFFQAVQWLWLFNLLMLAGSEGVSVVRFEVDVLSMQGLGLSSDQDFTLKSDFDRKLMVILASFDEVRFYNLEFTEMTSALARST